MLDDNIGHWPQIEAPDAVLEHFLAHIDRVAL
jgi:pimeloyl-ACP methyl ester carboxylesterase